MDKKLLSSLNNLSTALETISELLSKKSDKKTDTAKALSSGDLSKQFEKLSKSIKEGIESSKSQNKNTPKDTGLGNLSKKINEIGNSVKNLLSSSKQILSMQKSISETKPEVIVSVEKLKVPPMKPIEIPLRYGKLEPLKLPIPKPIELTFSKLKSPTLPKLKSIEVPLTFGKLPKTPTLPKLKPIDIPLSFGKLPKLPTLPKFQKIELGFKTPKLPKMPPLPKEHKIDLSFNKPTLPKLPKPKPLIVDVIYKKTTKKPTVEEEGKEGGGLFGNAGDPKAKKNIKDGVTMIILIAAGVLAIGLAFKIVGGINFGSVVGLGIAISILAVAFSKLAEQKNLTPARAAGLTAVLVGISLAVMLSSLILSAVRPVGLFQLFTAIMIAGMFSVISYGLGNLLLGMSKITGKSLLMIPLLPFIMVGISMAITASSFILGAIRPIGLFQAITAILIAGMFSVVSYGIGNLLSGLGKLNTKSIALIPLLPLVLVAISAAIVGSSYLLAGVKPIGLFQAITAIFIAAVFATISFGLGKLLKGFEGMDPTKAAVMAVVLPILLIAISAAILGSSFLLAGVKPIGLFQAFTAILIGIIFIPISYAIPQITKGIKDVNPAKVALIPIIMVAMALTIMLSSYILAEVKVVPFSKLMSALGTSIVLAAIGLGMGFVFDKLSKYTKKSMIDGGINLAIIATSVVVSSLILSLGKYDKYPTIDWIFFAGIALVGFGYAILALNKLGLKPTDIAKGGISVLAIATTIALTSHILATGNYTTTPPLGWMFNTAIGLVVFGFGIYTINKFASPTDILKGSISVLLIAGTIMATSLILALGNYSKAPPLDWTISVAAAMIPFGVAAVLLGTIATSGIGAVALAAGLVSILAVAGTIVATDAILKLGDYSKTVPLNWTINTAAAMIPFGLAAVALGPLLPLILVGGLATLAVAGIVIATDAILATGNYSKYPSLDWSKSVSLTMAAFATGMTVLGGIIVASFGVGAVALAAGSAAVLGVAETIVLASEILGKGNYTGGPTEQWARGVALSLGAFSGVYSMLAKNAIFSLFGGGIGPKEFGESIVTIADSINIAAEKLSKGNFTGGPDVKWASGVAIAIGAFGQVYKMLLDNAGPAFFSSGVSPEQFSSAIVTVSQGINDSAKKLSEGKFTGGPTKEWAEGVSLALGGFSPIYKILADNAGVWSSGVSAEDFSKAIVSISQGIVDAAFILSTGTVAYVNGPKKEWAEGVSIALQGFTGIFQALNSNSGWFTGGLEPEDYKKAIKSTGEGLVEAAKAIGGEGVVYDVSKVPGKEWGDKITGAFMAFIPALKYINEQSGWFSNGAEDTVTNMAAIATAVKDASITLATGNYTINIDPKWSSGIKAAVNNFLGILKVMSEQDFDYDDEYEHLKSSANVLVSVSVILSRGKYVEISKSYMDNLRTNVTTFVNLLTFIGKSSVDDDKLDQVKQLSTSIKDVSLILAQGNFNKMIPKPWMDSVRANLTSFSQMISSFDSGGFLSMFSDSTSEKVTELANGIIELAKIFNENKVPFDIKRVPSIQWSQGFSTAMSSIMPGLNYISENSGFLTSGEDKFKSGVSAIADALVSVSRKLALGKFDKIINPNYFKNLSQNITSYINIIKSVEESDADYDSVSDMADSMVELAKAYDKLGSAIEGLNGQLGAVDLEKMTMLKNLTGSVVMLSLMDADQFSSMMDALEDKAKILLDVVKDTEASATKEAATTTTPAAGAKGGGGAKVSTTPVKTAPPKESESQKMMSQLSASLSGLQSAVSQIAGVIAGGSGVSLKTYMESKMKTEKKPLGS